MIGTDDIDDTDVTSVRSVLAERLAALLADRPRANPAVVAEAVRAVCAVDHVALVEIESGICSVVATAGADLLAIGTRSPAVVSSRLVAVSAGREWSSADLSREPGFDRPIDQLYLSLGIRAGAGFPLTLRGRPVGAVLLSSTTPGRDWAPLSAAIGESAGLLGALLGFGRGHGEPLRVVVVHPDPLVAHGLARVVERGLPAEVDVAAGLWDPRLGELVAKADVIVADSVVEWAKDLEGLVVVHDHPGPVPASGNVVSREAAPRSLVVAVARASSVAGADRPAAPGPGLSTREFELLRELATGRSYKEIATRLQLSAATVRSYSRGLYAKLGVHSRGEAVAKASRSGLLEV
ncbi:response regulator transcription factor [Amycolatopsis sp. FDAARGOS 1241]|uniref:response regulator transcription factor n=1 Tax=Amycolatopsis sp. FDAARGOS 1241 TaxID=2778070 RepID=UPI0019502BA1|nr:LuxR C-terminal-related transcriptional regulator [Amycolatopsis sp. FDAARGOS 1241]QRP42655.1 response regulator transcription factor [Amycolatopsis sp. FDAARGOS 1241]